MSLKDLAFARRLKVRSEAVPMPDWGDGAIVHVHELTAAERDSYEASQLARDKDGTALDNFRARLVALTARDAEGRRIFTDGDVAAVGELPAGDVQRLYEVAARLNRSTAEQVKDAEKN